MTLLGIIVTIALVFLNGFFVAAEFAIVKVRASQVEVKTGVSSQRAHAAKNIINNLDAYLAATQLGITLASLALGWVGEEVMTSLVLRAFSALELTISSGAAHGLAVAIGFFIITILHIVFGELAPKSLAIRYPLSTTLNLSLPLKIFYSLFRPLIWILNNIANLMLNLIGIQPLHGNEIHSEDELKLIIAESQEGGAIDVSERELIQNVFDFDNRLVRDVMVPYVKIVGIDEETSFDDVLKMVIEEGYSRYPVYKDNLDNIIGILNTKDLLKALSTNNRNFHSLLRPVVYTTSSKAITDLLKEFQSKRSQMAIVANEFGGTDGMVTMEDIIEELVGEIQDEFDNETPVVQQVNETTFIVNAHERVYELNKYLPSELPEKEDYETLSGMIIYNAKKFPEINEVLEMEGYQIKILRTFKRSVDLVEMRWLRNDSQE